MNWKRGFIRLWSVFSLAWICFFGWEYYDGLERSKFWLEATRDLGKRIEIAIKREEKGIQTAARNSDELKQARDDAYLHKSRNQSRANDAVYLGLAVPFGLLIVGNIGLWIGRGFRAKENE
jgi:hypothetical protein